MNLARALLYFVGAEVGIRRWERRLVARKLILALRQYLLVVGEVRLRLRQRILMVRQHLLAVLEVCLSPRQHLLAFGRNLLELRRNVLLELEVRLRLRQRVLTLRQHLVTGLEFRLQLLEAHLQDLGFRLQGLAFLKNEAGRVAFAC